MQNMLRFQECLYKILENPFSWFPHKKNPKNPQFEKAPKTRASLRR